MKNGLTVYLLVAIWILVFAQSFWNSAGVEEAQNAGSGFTRLDDFFRFQLLALILAVIAAVLGFVSAGKRRRLLFVGLAPLAVTLVFVIGTLAMALITNPAGA